MFKEVIHIDNIDILVTRKTVKNINLRIKKDGTIIVSANKAINIKKLERFLLSKKDWITKNIEKNQKRESEIQKRKELEYINGEVFRIQGHKYIFMVISSDKNIIEIEENIIYLYTNKENDYDFKKKMFDKYIKNKAIELFEISLNEMMLLVKPFGVKKPKMKIRQMKSRWGTCNKTKEIITINLELLKLQKSCLDYVILHELIHFKVSGHNKEFYKYMELLMPDWKKQKTTLKQAATKL